MSEQKEMQEQGSANAEVTKKTSVYELPSLPVEFPPKDDEDGLDVQPRRSVTFEIEDTVNSLCVYI